MNDDTRRILELLSQGKITVEEADQLLRAIRADSSSASTASAPADAGEKRKPRYLRIAVHKQAGDRTGEKDVTIRLPLGIVRSGMCLGAVIPAFAGEHAKARMREHGLDIDFSKIDSAAIESMLDNFGEMDIDIDSGRKKVRISCE